MKCSKLIFLKGKNNFQSMLHDCQWPLVEQIVYKNSIFKRFENVFKPVVLAEEVQNEYDTQHI